jgi:hypothetical protein
VAETGCSLPARDQTALSYARTGPVMYSVRRQ